MTEMFVSLYLGFMHASGVSLLFMLKKSQSLVQIHEDHLCLFLFIFLSATRENSHSLAANLE